MNRSSCECTLHCQAISGRCLWNRRFDVPQSGTEFPLKEVLQRMRARRPLSTLFLLLAFAVIQIWAPLLHAHVGSGGLAEGTGLHLPDVVPNAGHGAEGPHVAVVHEQCGQNEGAIVTAPAEHRRDDRVLVRVPAPGAAVAPGVRIPAWRVPADSCPQPAEPRAASADAAPPFPVGPPATT